MVDKIVYHMFHNKNYIFDDVVGCAHRDFLDFHMLCYIKCRHTFWVFHERFHDAFEVRLVYKILFRTHRICLVFLLNELIGRAIWRIFCKWNSWSKLDMLLDGPGDKWIERVSSSYLQSWDVFGIDHIGIV